MKIKQVDLSVSLRCGVKRCCSGAQWTLFNSWVVIHSTLNILTRWLFRRWSARETVGCVESCWGFQFTTFVRSPLYTIGNNLVLYSIYYSHTHTHTPWHFILSFQVQPSLSRVCVCVCVKHDSQPGSRYAEIQPSNRLVAGIYPNTFSSLFSRF